MNIRSSVKKLIVNLSPPKYYYVGLAITGNQTAGRAMSLLGYRWIHYPIAVENLWKYEVATDTPVGMWFRQGLLPRNGIFILTVRDVQSWLEDCQLWYESRPIDSLNDFEVRVRQYVCGSLTFDRSCFEDSYYKHTEACVTMAKNMGVKLYEWNVVAEPNWDFLTKLTGRTTDKPFPFTPGKYAGTWDKFLEVHQKKV
ncbi:hypothetical protein [Argonema galeatum]|uniref:hypothetical protein n=1 Tax=Argonema galeatum TaxID=2942762 RepID=UPI002012C831|nr:hypothetical protein [Argonema galeatum]MCL1464462.1 hypothetical protein [Argonema galeatum A003/A1]